MIILHKKVILLIFILIAIWIPRFNSNLFFESSLYFQKLWLLPFLLSTLVNILLFAIFYIPTCIFKHQITRVKTCSTLQKFPCRSVFINKNVNIFVIFCRINFNILFAFCMVRYWEVFLHQIATIRNNWISLS